MRRVLEAAGMLPSLWMLNQLAGVYAPIMQSSATAIPVPESYREAHQNLFTALENRDSEAAKEAIDVYLAQMEAALLCRERNPGTPAAPCRTTRMSGLIA